MSNRDDQGFTAHDEPPCEDEQGHGDECTCAGCKSVRATQYQAWVEQSQATAEWCALRLNGSLERLGNATAKQEAA